MSLSINPCNNYKGRLGCKTKCCRHVYCWVFCDNYTAATEGKRQYSYEKQPVIQYCLINNLRANYWALIAMNYKRPYYHFSLPNCSLEVLSSSSLSPSLTPSEDILDQVPALARDVLLLACKCNIALNLYHTIF